MSATNRGITTINVGDDEIVLKPTLAAVRKIEGHFGGLRPAMQAMTHLSLSATCAVIIAGAGVKPKDAAALEEQVFQAGVGSIAPLLVPYLAFLINPSEQDEDEEGNAPTDEAP